MKQTFLDIKDQLETVITKDQLDSFNIPCERGISVTLWNDQVSEIEAGMEIPFQTPAFFIEFIAPTEVTHLGNGVQLFEPLDIKVHIVNDYYDAKDGTTDQDLEMFVLRNLCFKALQMFIPTKSTNMVRISEIPDQNHTNLIHYIQTYRTNLMDDGMEFPVGGSDYTPPPLTLDLTKNPS